MRRRRINGIDAWKRRVQFGRQFRLPQVIGRGGNGLNEKRAKRRERERVEERTQKRREVLPASSTLCIIYIARLPLIIRYNCFNWILQGRQCILCTHSNGSSAVGWWSFPLYILYSLSGRIFGCEKCVVKKKMRIQRRFRTTYVHFLFYFNFFSRIDDPDFWKIKKF